ncbi:unnamed protein product [Penicillium salamii]|uniref:LysM domain-containing protein n=1 Tax=Penicillium salamii TaxID=1612424 RepID=A0A9W4N3E2_9EURO|nr:unnamed protein product [Penicillium salamii]
MVRSMFCLFTYELSCRKDSTTGKYCDPLLASWSNQSLNASELCSDCWLGGLALELNSPFGYNSVVVANYASLISSYNATMYTYATPTQYALNAIATSELATVTTTPDSSCIGFYEVQINDTCNSVAQALNAETAVNSSLCIPPQCDTYVWQGIDTYDSVVGSLSNNAVNYIDYVVCVRGYLDYTIDTSGNSTIQNLTSIIFAVPAPTNALNGSTIDYGLWYIVGEGNTCSLVIVANAISLVDFYFLNPKIDTNCTNLELREAYCIAVVRDISTYSDYLVTTPLFTMTTASFPAVDTSIPMAISDLGYIYTPIYLPTTSETLTDYERYANYNNSIYNLNSCK